MNRTLLAALVITTHAPAATFAQDKLMIEPRTVLAAAEDARAQADAWKRWAEDYSRDMRSSMGTMFGARLGAHKLVKGAPYSAEVLTESNQNLADGNVISRKTRGAIYRDGEGRTRQESPGDGKEQAVFISDPLEGKTYVLTPGSKLAVTSSEKNSQVVTVNGRTVRVDNGRVFVDGKEMTQPVVEVDAGGKTIKVENGKVTIDGREFDAPPAGGKRKIVVKTINAGESGDNLGREEVRIQVVRGADGHMHPIPPVAPTPPLPPAAGHMAPPPPPPVPPMPGVSSFRFESPSKLGKGVATNLGMKDFDGVKAEGKSTVWTIPAGTIGNRNPINVSSETWYSPELQLTVYSRYIDPRTGESIYRLAGIKRAEPSPNLFKVPAGYEEKTRGR
ncbi:MAG: hypothetical protein ABIQ72_14050 [Usitatibacter sp.]